jgi:hypothetical protein
LDHEVFDEAMEGRVVVGAAGAEGEEVLSCLGDGFAENLELDVAVGGVELGDISYEIAQGGCRDLTVTDMVIVGYALHPHFNLFCRLQAREQAESGTYGAKHAPQKSRDAVGEPPDIPALA